MIPTLRTTVGVKGHRPLVGHWDGPEGIDVFAALHLVRGQWPTRLGKRLQQAKKPGTSKPRDWHAGRARPLRAIARTSPAVPYPPVVLVAKAPWHSGAVVTAVLAASPIWNCSRGPVTVRSGACASGVGTGCDGAPPSSAVSHPCRTENGTAQ